MCDQTWLSEVEVMVSTEETRRHLNDLLDHRKLSAQEINHQQQIEAGCDDEFVPLILKSL